MSGRLRQYLLRTQRRRETDLLNNHSDSVCLHLDMVLRQMAEAETVQQCSTAPRLSTSGRPVSGMAYPGRPDPRLSTVQESPRHGTNPIRLPIFPRLTDQEGLDLKVNRSVATRGAELDYFTFRSS